MKDDPLTSLGLLVLFGTEPGFATVGELWEHRSNNLPDVKKYLLLLRSVLEEFESACKDCLMLCDTCEDV